MAGKLYLFGTRDPPPCIARTGPDITLEGPLAAGWFQPAAFLCDWQAAAAHKALLTWINPDTSLLCKRFAGTRGSLQHPITEGLQRGLSPGLRRGQSHGSRVACSRCCCLQCRGAGHRRLDCLEEDVEVVGLGPSCGRRLRDTHRVGNWLIYPSN